MLAKPVTRQNQLLSRRLIIQAVAISATASSGKVVYVYNRILAGVNGNVVMPPTSYRCHRRSGLRLSSYHMLPRPHCEKLINTLTGINTNEDEDKEDSRFISSPCKMFRGQAAVTDGRAIPCNLRCGVI
ncbi:hypothetical protein J6590_056103 [Homalodisca vitripennis]|nr:hypothetical protein J6590_056103 [Homalodisca vitripennis]